MKKMVEAIEKKLGTVVNVNGTEGTGKEITVDVDLADGTSRKVVLKEMKNQYGSYYRMMSESRYTKISEKTAEKAEKKAAKKLKTKTERVCGTCREEIIKYAEKKIESLANGTAEFKEIEGLAKEDTVVRLVLIAEDGSRFKEDIEVEEIRSQAA